MGLRLKNDLVEIEIDLPQENYQFSRFDWSGKVVNAWFRGNSFTGFESLDRSKDYYLGKGFYNEFGIQAPLGFHELPIGSWCHKIGVGLLKKQAETYSFMEPYQLQPASFELSKDSQSIKLKSIAPEINGYGYELNKTISLHSQGFELGYQLENQGSKKIETTEYNHNFLSFNHSLIDHGYVLKFPFKIDQTQFDEFVNPEKLLYFDGDRLKFLKKPTKEFFISNLSGAQWVEATWALEHRKLRLGVQENANFQTNAINLWGTEHVISPELFVKIDLEPGASQSWSRTYSFYELD